MCSCKGAQLCISVLKAEYGKMSFNAENAGSDHRYKNHKKQNRQQAGLPFDCHLPCLEPRAPWGEGHRGVLCAGSTSKQELTQHHTNLGAKSCSCTALDTKLELQPWQWPPAGCSSTQHSTGSWSLSSCAPGDTPRAFPAPAEPGTLHWSGTCLLFSTDTSTQMSYYWYSAFLKYLYICFWLHTLTEIHRLYSQVWQWTVLHCQLPET